MNVGEMESYGGYGVFSIVLREETGSSLWIDKCRGDPCGRPEEERRSGGVKKNSLGKGTNPRPYA